MNSPKISIIIPVYNVEKYIQDCIESLINQTFHDCEFIFVNDGSTDNSKLIIESYLEKDKRIQLINQENKGVSVARNEGIAIARGQYIAFVDADDWIEEDMYQRLHDTMEQYQSDIVLCNMFGYVNGKQYVSGYEFPEKKRLGIDFIQDTLWRHLIQKDDLYSSCNKLFKAAIIKDNAINFPPGNKLSEDNVFNLKYFNKIQSFVYIDYTGYHYREVAGSAMRSILKMNYFENILRLYQVDYRGYLDLKFSDEEIEKIRSEKLINNTISLIHFYFVPTPQLSLIKRIAMIKKMLYHEDVVNVIQKYYESLYDKGGRYDQFILKAVKNQSIVKLYIATAYSRYRNK